MVRVVDQLRGRYHEVAHPQLLHNPYLTVGNSKKLSCILRKADQFFTIQVAERSLAVAGFFQIR